jgi:hypothetical protein
MNRKYPIGLFVILLVVVKNGIKKYLTELGV